MQQKPKQTPSGQTPSSKAPYTADANNPRYHHYHILAAMCKRGDPDSTIPTVFETLVANGEVTAPGRPEGPNKGWARGQTADPGTIQTTIDRENFTVTNITTPDHVLAPGVVETKVVEFQDEASGETFVGLQREGVGEGRMPLINEGLAWSSMELFECDWRVEDEDIPHKRESRNRK